VDGLLLDADTPLALQVWTNRTSETWEEMLPNGGSLKTGLQGAMDRLALRVLIKIEPQTAAMIASDRWQDEDALSALTGLEESMEHDLQRAKAQLEALNLGEAVRLLEGLKH
jgi:hypothetical protein